MQLLVFEFTSFISTFVFLEDSTQLNLQVQQMHLIRLMTYPIQQA